MKPGRNDPCPCGSGRKYKQCCQARDQSSEAAASTKQHVLEVAAREPVWEADAVPLLVSIAEGAKHRPVVILVGAGELVLGTNVRDRLSGEPDALAEALEREIVAAARQVGSFPEAVAVRFPELRDPLQARLAPHGVGVEVRGSLGLEPAARGLIEHMTGVAQWPPVSVADSWSAWRVPSSAVRDLFAAAAEFWRRAPWKIMDDEQTPQATFRSGRTWTAGVMGHAGLQFGLSLYSESTDIYSIATAAGPEDAMAALSGRAISISYDATAEIPPMMRVEAQSEGWEIAGPKAFPRLMTINTPGGGVTQQEIEELAALLRAIPEFADTHAEELEGERLSGIHSEPLTWADFATGLRLRYEGSSDEEYDDDDEGDWEFALNEEVDLAPEDQRELQRVARDVLEELGPNADADSFVRLVTERGRHVLDRIAKEPRSNLGGLSANQLAELVEADWLDDDGPVRLQRHLPLETLSGAVTLRQCRRLLGYAAERGGIPATESGNLATAVVAELLDEFGGGPNVRPDGTPRRVIEPEVESLHLSRVLLELGWMLVRDRRRFEVSDLGERLLPDESAGELFARLFATCFQELDLGSRGGLQWRELQEQVAYTLHRLIGRENQWATPEELLQEVVSPLALRSAPRLEIDAVPALLLEMRVLRRLVEFGLMEIEDTAISYPDWRRYRATPLLAEFVTVRP